MNELNFGDGFHLTPDVMTFLVNACQNPSAYLYKDMDDCIIYGCKETTDNTYTDGAIVYGGEIYPVKGGTSVYGKAKLVHEITQNVYKDGKSKNALFDNYFEIIESDDYDIKLDDFKNIKITYRGIRSVGYDLAISQIADYYSDITEKAILYKFGYNSVSSGQLLARLMGGDVLMISGGIKFTLRDTTSVDLLFNVSGINIKSSIYFNATALFVNDESSSYAPIVMRLETNGNVRLMPNLSSATVQISQIIFPATIIYLQQ